MYNPKKNQPSGFSQLVIWLLIVGTCCLWGSCNRAAPESSPNPVIDSAAPVSRFPDTPAGRALATHVNNIYALDENSEAAYQISLDSLRSHGAEVTELLVRLYEQAPSEYYSDRILMVQLLSELNVTEALAPLVKIAQSSLPEQGNLTTGEVLVPLEEELQIRMAAISALPNYALSEGAALEAILALQEHKEPILSEYATYALAEVIRRVENRKLKSELMARLPDWFEYKEVWTRPRPVAPPNGKPDLKPNFSGNNNPPRQ